MLENKEWPEYRIVAVKCAEVQAFNDELNLCRVFFETEFFLFFRFTQNYGVLGVLDRLHGTDVMFRDSRAYDRHIMLLGFTPLKQTFPDNPKKGSPNKTK